MLVIIDREVYAKINHFYAIAMILHPTLGEGVVEAKKHRLYAAVRKIGQCPGIYPLARVKKDWIKKHYREMIYEDFHFAFDYVTLDTGEVIVYVFDAVHSKLNH